MLIYAEVHTPTQRLRTKLHAIALNEQDVIVGHAERGPWCGRHVLDMLNMLHVSVRIVAGVEHVQTTLMLVQSDAGITFVPGALADIKIDGT